MSVACADQPRDHTAEWDEQLATDERWVAFHTTYGPPVWRKALGLLKQAEEAEDATQEAFAKIDRQYRAHKEARTPIEQPLIPYLYRTIHTCAIDRYRALRPDRQGAVPADDAEGKRLIAPDDDPGELVVTKEQLAYLARCIDRLPSPDRAVLRLYRLEEYSLREIAATLGLTYEEVRTRVKVGHQRLEDQLAWLYLNDALLGLDEGDRAIVAPFYHRDHGEESTDQYLTWLNGTAAAAAPVSAADFTLARKRLFTLLLQHERRFGRMKQQERRALARFAADASHRAHSEVSSPPPPAEADATVQRAIHWLDRQLRGMLP